MATIILTIPDAQLPRVIAAVCASRTDPDTLQPIPATGPNAKAIVVDWVKECVANYEMGLAKAAITVDVTNIVT